jgi:subtilisin family serine protease
VRRPARVAPVAVAAGVAAAVGLAPGCCRAQATVPDLFYEGGTPVSVIIHLDSLGVLPQVGVARETVATALAAMGLSAVRDLPDGIIVAALSHSVPRAELFLLGRTVRSAIPQLVMQAGPLVRRVAGGAPLVATDQVVARFGPSVSWDQIDSLNRVLGAAAVAQTRFARNHFLLQGVVDSARDAIALARWYRESGLAASAFPNFLGGAEPTSYTPNDPLYARQWHLRNSGQTGGTAGADIDAPDAWDVTRGDPSIVIAVIEITGFDVGHPDLAANLWSDPGNPSVHGWNFAPCSQPLSSTGGSAGPPTCGNASLDGEPRYHGTAVAGLAAGVGDNTKGISGVCPRCRIMPIVTSAAWYNKQAAFWYAAGMGARVINASWAQMYNADIADAMEDAAKTGSHGIPIVMSVFNNSGTDECELDANRTLASLDEVIAVGASNDKDVRMPGGTGPCLAVLAPGGTAPDLWGITTTDQRGEGGYNAGDRPTGAVCGVTELSDRDYTACFAGTSAAAPIVSGVIGLMLSANPSLGRAQVKEILEETADKVQPAAAAYDGTGLSLTYGHGRVNAAQAVEHAESAHHAWCWWMVFVLAVLAVAVVVMCRRIIPPRWKGWRRRQWPPVPPPPLAD